MGRDLTNGKWFDVLTQKQHQNLKRCGRLEYDDRYTSRVQKGTYTGPGRYMVLSYEQRCPRGCCYDSVHEVVSASTIVEEVRQEITNLASILREARSRTDKVLLDTVSSS